jgi:hypothetical protein
MADFVTHFGATGVTLRSPVYLFAERGHRRSHYRCIGRQHGVWWEVADHLYTLPMGFSVRRMQSTWISGKIGPDRRILTKKFEMEDEFWRGHGSGEDGINCNTGAVPASMAEGQNDSGPPRQGGIWICWRKPPAGNPQELGDRVQQGRQELRKDLE